MSTTLTGIYHTTSPAWNCSQVLRKYIQNDYVHLFNQILPFLCSLNFFCFSSSPFTNWELQTEFWFPHHGRFAPIYGASNDRGAPFSSCFSPSYQFHIYMTTLRVFRPTAFTSTSNSKFKWPSALFLVFFAKTCKQFRIYTITLFRLLFSWWVLVHNCTIFLCSLDVRWSMQRSQYKGERSSW